MAVMETVQRIEPARLEESGEAVGDVIAELSAASSTLARALHPRTAANLGALVRVMNAYYSNLIEGRNTRPKDIESALAGVLENDPERQMVNSGSGPAKPSLENVVVTNPPGIPNRLATKLIPAD